jgi:hypothetical protein
MLFTRIIGGQTFTLGYDAENRLTGVAGLSLTASFVYDGDGERVPFQGIYGADGQPFDCEAFL